MAALIEKRAPAFKHREDSGEKPLLLFTRTNRKVLLAEPSHHLRERLI